MMAVVKMKDFCRFAVLKGHRSKECFNKLIDFLPLPGARVTRKPRRGYLLWPIAIEGRIVENLSAPRRGYILSDDTGDAMSLGDKNTSSEASSVELSSSSEGAEVKQYGETMTNPKRREIPLNFFLGVRGAYSDLSLL